MSRWWRRRQISRWKVYRIIDEERQYQDSLGGDRTDNPTGGEDPIPHTVGDFSTMLQQYQNELVEAWTKNPGDEPALHVMRKIAAIAVNCMEQHGAPPRILPPNPVLNATVTLEE